MLKKGHYSSRISVTAAAYLAGVIDYLTAEILETAGNICHDRQRKTLAPKDINLGMRMDEEIMKMMHSVTVLQGGMVIPKTQEKDEKAEGDDAKKSKSKKQEKKASKKADPKPKEAKEKKPARAASKKA